MKRKLSEIGLIFVFYILQVTLFNYIRIGGIAPNLLIILPIFFGLLKGKKEGIFVGICSGFIYDMFVSGILGFSMLIYTVIGYICGMFFNQYEESNYIIPLLLTTVGTFSYGFLSFVVQFLLHNRIIADFFIMRIIMPEVIYTVIVALIIYKPIRLLNGILDKKKSKAVNLDEEIHK